MFDDYDGDYVGTQKFNLLGFCAEIERLKRIEFLYIKLLAEHEKLEKDYQQMFESNMKHSQTMMRNFLELALECPENIEKAFGKKNDT